MVKILFFLPTLGNGGAERVLINLVNTIDKNRFEVTVKTLFNKGENRELLSKDVKYEYCFNYSIKGISKISKIFSPRILHKILIKDKYDIEVSYLEGLATRVISGCDDEKTKTVAWVHTEFKNKEFASLAYRNYDEANKCYNSFDRVVSVSKRVNDRFYKLFNVPVKKTTVKYNTNESDKIIKLSKDKITDVSFYDDEIKIIAIGKIIENKGFDRLARVQKRMIETGYKTHVYIVGAGKEREKIETYLIENDIEQSYTFLGYQKNPYKYLSKCDVFVCSSFREGFSTATTEAIILGIPVVSVDVSGAKELLGDNNDYGIVTENNENALYEGLCKLISTNNLLDYYKRRALIRGKEFSAIKTTKAVESMLEELLL